ncbi:dTMP kinase [Streptosporangium sp. KLBMP 9127]|nr:dTMP kinase [Streptosporangium sp. KLBMP 9127]
MDGPSGVGKSEVCRLLADMLVQRGAAVVATGQPSHSPMGRLARSATHELHGLALTFLMAADRHHHQDEVILPALEAGRVVVCDRYVPTALVLDQMDGADPAFITTLYRHMFAPDLAVLLTGDPATCRERAARRGTYSRFHEGGVAAASTEAGLYEQAAGLLTSLGYPVISLDIGDRTAEQVTVTVLALVGELLALSRGG